MRYFFRNLHVYVFALVSVFFGVWVANNPHETQRYLRPLVEDTVELKELAQGAYREVAQLDLRTASEEAVSLFVATMRMPTMLFERLAEKLDAVEKDLDQRKAAKSVGGVEAGHVQKAKVSMPALGTSGGMIERPRSPGI